MHRKQEMHGKQNTVAWEVYRVRQWLKDALSFMYKNRVIYYLNPIFFKYGLRCLMRAITLSIHCGFGTSSVIQVQCNCLSGQLSPASSLKMNAIMLEMNWQQRTESFPPCFCRIALNLTVQRFSIQYSQICFKGCFVKLYSVQDHLHDLHDHLHNLHDTMQSKDGTLYL